MQPLSSASRCANWKLEKAADHQLLQLQLSWLADLWFRLVDSFACINCQHLSPDDCISTIMTKCWMKFNFCPRRCHYISVSLLSKGISLCPVKRALWNFTLFLRNYRDKQFVILGYEHVEYINELSFIYLKIYVSSRFVRKYLILRVQTPTFYSVLREV